MIHVKGSLGNNFCVWVAITHNFKEKIVKKRTGAQIQNSLLYLKVEA